ncbi:phosphoribosylglycinamide formyltransferase [Spongorhabdus nitratireducens]
MTDNNTSALPIVVLISGSGSNLQAMIDRQQELNIEIRAVISNKPDAYGLTRAANANIPVKVLNHKDCASREAFDTELARLIDDYEPGLVVLAGFMRLLTPAFTEHYAGRMLNIHPSLLPKYKGLHTHRRVIEAGESEHGTTVHFVTAELDGGPLVLQAKVALNPEEQESELGRRVQQQEYIIYPLCVQWFATGRLRLDGNTPILDGKPVSKEGLLLKSELLDEKWRHSSEGSIF